MARILRANASGRNVLVAFALLTALTSSFGLYFTPAFERVSGGLQPFDMQFPLSHESVVIQLALLTPESVSAYTGFMVVDFIFPPFGALCWTLLWAWALQKIAWPRWDALFEAGFWSFPFFGAACDWAENILFYRIIAAAPRPLPDTIDLALQIHDAKLRLLLVTATVTVILLVTAGGVLMVRKIKTL